MSPGEATGEPTALVRLAQGGLARWYLRSAEGTHALPGHFDLGDLLELKLTELHGLVNHAQTSSPEPVPAEPTAPVAADTEIWAAGVTYEVSRGARMQESREATVYERVYAADRPELFFKAVGWRASGPSGNIGIRADSGWDVPEPELAVVVNAHQEIVGYTICNDVSSRSIEGENPLYLPQAKLYRGSCALGPGIVPVWEITDPYALAIDVRIDRHHELVWSGSTTTALLHRRLDELVDHLYRGDLFPRGVVLATGTAAVPPPDITLRHGDVVTIDIESVGCLRNRVVRGVDNPAWDT